MKYLEFKNFRDHDSFQVRPHLELTFDNILSHINTVYVLKTKPGVMKVDPEPEFSPLRLKVGAKVVVSVFLFTNLSLYLTRNTHAIAFAYAGRNDIRSRIRRRHVFMLP